MSTCSRNSNRSNGITDCQHRAAILAQRVFDNVRWDLLRQPSTLVLNAACAGALVVISAVSTGVTGSFTPDTILPIENSALSRVSGTIIMEGECTYTCNGVTLTAPCTVSVPFNAAMLLPEQSIFPYEFTVNASFFSDTATPVSPTSFNVLTDGIVLVMVTATVPMCVNSSCPMVQNPISERAIPQENGFLSADAYPTASSETTCCCTKK